jgi:hypothetical protein
MTSGPVARGDGTMVVSLTELTPCHARDWPLIARDGLDATLARRDVWLTT